MSKSPKKSAKRLRSTRSKSGYGFVLADVVQLLDAARRTSARAVNAVMTATYWQIGRRIVEYEQTGADRADYGAVLLTRLARDLTKRIGRGFGRSNLYQMRGFYLQYQDIFQMLSGKLESPKTEIVDQHSNRRIVQTSSGKFTPTVELASCFPLPWSHYVRLIAVDNPLARSFYETEALRGGWTVKQLERQINTQFYERTALSRNKLSMLTRHNTRKKQDLVSAEEEIKDPLVLEFLDLKDEYSESSLEDSLVQKLESFLLELGNDFTFVGRQRRMRVGHAWYKVDLLLFHRRLKCLVIVDLKTGRFTHADAGQMILYCNYAAEHWTNPGENPPVGLILCSDRDEAVARYSLEGLSSKVMAHKYRIALPSEQRLAAEIEKTRRMLERRGARQATNLRLLS